MDQVRLPDLEVIKRFSIAVRREHASVEEVLEALRADLETVTRASGTRRAQEPRSTGAPERSAPAKSTPRPSKPAARPAKAAARPTKAAPRTAKAASRSTAKPAASKSRARKTLGRVTPVSRKRAGTPKPKAKPKPKSSSRGARRR